jgi:ribosomal protein S18 acetylase RimI-like enzyme
MNQSYESIRRAQSGDEPALRQLRIQALSDAPTAFGSTLDRELNRSAAEWARWLTPTATFLLEVEGVPKGLAAGVPDQTDPGLVYLMAMWLHPALRGSGAADRLVHAVLTWATSIGADLIQLDVIQGNEAAIRLYERHGFRPTGHTAMRARDGAVEIQMERSLPPASSSAGIPDAGNI